MIDISLEDDIFINDITHLFIQELDVVFNTRLTEVIGDYAFGSDFEQFLWSMKDNTDEITHYVKRIIQEQCKSSLYVEWDAACTYVYDENGKEFYYIIIVVTDETGNPITRSYVMHDYARETPIIKSTSI